MTSLLKPPQVLSVLFVGPLILLIYTYGYVSPGIQSQSGFPCLCTLSPTCNGFLGFTCGVTPADLLATKLFSIHILACIQALVRFKSGIEHARKQTKEENRIVYKSLYSLGKINQNPNLEQIGLLLYSKMDSSLPHLWISLEPKVVSCSPPNPNWNSSLPPPLHLNFCFTNFQIFSCRCKYTFPGQIAVNCTGQSAPQIVGGLIPKTTTSLGT